tara:strand:- start:300 stop:1844 length:1545 start_codon:yes stop_codon:yes gene_type:complete
MDKDQLVQEFKKCKADPEYFISKYIKVTHPVRGLVPFDLYPFQKKILSNINSTKNRFNILRKFRQAGATTLGSAYCLWISIFSTHQAVVILSKGDAESTEVLDRIKLMYDELPTFFKPGISESNKHTLKFNNYSVIKSRPSGKQSGRSLAGSFLMIDEAAFIENIDTIWAAVYPIISTGGRALVLSTVNGVGNWYHDVYLGAMGGSNSFNPIDIRWQDHPEYSRHATGYDHLYKEMEKKHLFVDDWEKTAKSNMPHKQWLQEYECEFLGTGDTFIEGYLLKRLLENANEEYGIKYNNKMRVWKDPEVSYDYLIGVDVSIGRDGDYSAFHIMNTYTGEQVAEFYSNKTPINEFAQIINEEGLLYNNALVVIERNTIGNNLVDWLYNYHEYDNLWIDDKGNFGYQVTVKNREELLVRLEEYIRNDILKINSKRTVSELLTFIINATGKIEADKGKHDDLIMSLGIAVQVLHTIMDGTPLDIEKNPHKERKPLLPTSHKANTAFGGYAEEDIKWLMK